MYNEMSQELDEKSFWDKSVSKEVIE